MTNFTFTALSRKLLIILGLITFSTLTWSQCDDLFFTQYHEGSGSNKCLEIYNPTSSTIILDSYTIRIFSNGNPGPGANVIIGWLPTSPGGNTIAAGASYVICNGSQTMGVAANRSTASINFNGNDVVTLNNAGTVIDALGQLGNDANFGADVHWIRKSSVLGGDTDETDAFSFAGSGEWDAGTVDDGTGFGSHTFTGECPSGDPQPGDLVITEIFQNPSGSDTGNEWFEVYNATGSDIDLNGFEISDNGTDSHVIGSSVIVPAGGYVVLASGTGAVTGGVDYVYSGITLANGDDEVILTSPGEVEIDRVEYDGGPNFPDPDGASMSLDPTMIDATANNIGSNWCEGSSSFSGDTNGLGTPGSANDACEIACNISNVTVEFDDLCEGSDAVFRLSFDVVGGSGQYEIVDYGLGTGYGNFLFGGSSGNFFVNGTITGPTTAQTLMFSIQEVGAGEGGCRGEYVSVDIATCPIPVVCSGVGDIIITEIMRNPAVIDDNDGEYIEIYNTTESPIDINGWTLGDADTDSHTINGSVVVPANGYALLMRNGNMATNGGLTADYVYGNDISLANGTDEVILSCPGTGVIDQVFYSNPAFPSPSGASMNLDLGSFDATANDNGANWCISSMPYETNNAGTPGMMNETCCAPPTAVCNMADLSINLNDGNMIEASDIDAGSTAECGLFSMTVAPNTFNCTQVGTNVTVTLTVVDNNADVSSCTAGVQVSGLPCGFTQEEINCDGDTYSDYSPTTGAFYLGTDCSETAFYRPTDSQGFIQADLCGDGEIIAQVTYVEGAGYAGIAMREGTGPSEKLIELGIDGNYLTRRSLRLTTGGVAFNHLFATQGKNWLRLTRQGNVFGAYHSLDGSNWQPVLITQIAMSSCIDIGMFVTSSQPGYEVEAIFENVMLNSSGTLQAPEQHFDIADIEVQEVELFPNPATDELNVNLGSFAGQNVTISILNINGQAIKQVQLDEVYEGSNRIDVSTLNNGTYLMRIESGDNVVSKRFIINGK